MNRSLALAIGFCFAVTTPSVAQNVAPFVSINSGIGMPGAPEVFREYWNPAVNVGVRIGGLNKELDSSGVFLSANYARFFGDSQIDDINTLTVFGNGKLAFASTGGALPYVLAGIGYFRISGGDASENAVGAQGGIGVSFVVNEQTNIFIEGIYTAGATEGAATQYVNANIGVTLLLK